jgi:hypothetical protein
VSLLGQLWCAATADSAAKLRLQAAQTQDCEQSQADETRSDALHLKLPEQRRRYQWLTAHRWYPKHILLCCGIILDRSAPWHCFTNDHARGVQLFALQKTESFWRLSSESLLEALCS